MSCFERLLQLIEDSIHPLHVLHLESVFAEA